MLELVFMFSTFGLIYNAFCSILFFSHLCTYVMFWRAFWWLYVPCLAWDATHAYSILYLKSVCVSMRKKVMFTYFQIQTLQTNNETEHQHQKGGLWPWSCRDSRKWWIRCSWSYSGETGMEPVTFTVFQTKWWRLMVFCHGMRMTMVWGCLNCNVWTFLFLMRGIKARCEMWLDCMILFKFTQ